jgi:hypothetical protein
MLEQELHRCLKPRAESREPKAESLKPRAGSLEPKAQSPKHLLQW